MAKMSFEEYKQDYLKRKQAGEVKETRPSATGSTSNMSFDEYKTNYLKTKFTERSNSWLKNSAGYFGVEDDEYTPEYFNTRKQTASDLANEADSILSGYKSNFGEDSEEYKGFKSYYDQIKQGLADSVSYYGQNPYLVKYKDSDEETLDSNIKRLMTQSGVPAFSKNTEENAELQALYDLKQYIKSTSGHQLDEETEEQKFIRENIGKDIADIINSEEYQIGQSYFDAAENSLIRVNGFDVSALTDDNRDIMKYLAGRKLKEKGYDAFNAGDLESSEYLAQLPESEDWTDVNNYLDSISDERNNRIAQEQFNRIKDKPVLEVLEMLKQGIISNPVGIYRSLAFGQDNTDITASEYLAQMIDEDLADSGAKLPDKLGGRSVGQVLGGLAQSYGQMLPSQALSLIPYAGPALSSVSFGMSAGGNAKVELMREGYDETSATIYGMLVGGAEAGLEKLMGSIPGLSSSVGKGVTKGIKNAFLKAAADFGIDVVKEAVEESSQEILAPVFKSIATRDASKLNELDWSEVAYAGFQGALMSGGSNAPGTVASAVKGSQSAVSKTADSTELQSVNTIINDGLNKGESTDAYKYAAQLQKKMADAYDKAVSKGMSSSEAEVEAARAVKTGQLETLTYMNLRNADSKTGEAIKSRLSQLGATGNLNTLAQSIYKQFFINTYGTKVAENVGIELSRSQKKALNSSEYATQVLEELDSGSEKWSADLREELSQMRYEAKSQLAYKDGISATKLKEIESVSSNNAAVRGNYKKGNAAKRLSDNATVGVVGVEYSDGNGAVTYKLSTGETADGSDIQFDDGFIDYAIQEAPKNYATESANAYIKTAVEYQAYAQNKGVMATSKQLMSSFEDLRKAGLKGITFEQAAGDIHLSGDVGRIGETAARIAINDGLASYQNGSGEVAKHSFSSYNKRKSKKTPYSQYRTEALRWSKSSSTKVGDVMFLPKNLNSAAIIQATEDGYVELNSGSYEKVRGIYERTYGKAVDEIYGNLESLKAEQGRDIWDMQLSGDGRNDDGNSESIGEPKLRGNATGGFQNSGRSNNGAKGKVTVAPGIKLNDTDRAILKRIAKSGNVPIVIEKFSGADKYSKGFYTGGVIHLNADKLSEGGFTYTGFHEAGHYVKDVNPEGYKAIEKFVENYYKEKGVNIKAEIKATQNLYKQRGQELTVEEAMEEIVCNTISDIATDEDALTAFLGLDSKTQNTLIEAIKSLVKKLKEWAAKYLKGTEYHSIVINDADTLLSLAKQFKTELAKAGEKNNTAENSGGVKRSFGGTKANNAPSPFLKAERMEENGVDNETIRQETGWFKGYDGMWRFEIDDSESQFSIEGDMKLRESPRYLRLVELSDKDNLTSAEQTELSELEKEFEDDVWRTKWRLDDYLKHDKLFESYPMLRSVGVDFQSLPEDTGGFYSARSNTIVFNSKIRSNKRLRSIALHEAQHAIQLLEQFANGSNINYWQSKLDGGYDSRTYEVISEERELREEYENISTSDPEFYNDMIALEKILPVDIPRAPINWDTLESIGEDPVEWQRYDEQRDKLVEKYGESKVFDFMFLSDRLKNIATKGTRSARDLYYATAGEVEARDVQKRMNLTTEQRKNTRPDIDRTDVVFSDYSTESNSIGYATNGEPVLVVNDDILRDARTDKEIVDVVKQYIGRFKKVPIRGQNIFFTSKSKDEYVNSRYTNKLKNKDKQTYLDKMRMAAHPYDIVYATTDYVNEAPKHKRKDNLIDFSRGKLLADISGSQYTADVVVGFTKSGICVLYDIVSMQPTQFEYKKEVTSVEGMDSYESTRSDITSSKDSIPNSIENVKHSLSPKTDAEYFSAVESGDTATAQRLVVSAAESAMKDSKIRDKSGKLVKVYHGSDSADFYEFDKSRRGQTDSSMYGRGYYFAFDPDYSSDFGENIREFYLDIKNPYYIDINAPASKIANFLKSKGVKVDFDYNNMISHFFAKNFGSQKFTDTLIDLGYDGVIVRTDEGDYWEAVAFHRNQMKLADAVTYDDEGNVIPISERFNANKRDVRYSFEGYAEDGKGKYKSNYPKGTPRKAKGERILHYIQDVWSKNPITLRIEKDGDIRYIEAQFDPDYDPSGNKLTDASKLMGGNRHGTSSEQRVTLDLADDYYKIASEAKYNYSKDEIGKDIPTHENVKEWHYFVNDIYFSEYESDEYIPYRVTINVKEKNNGHFVYSFSAEKQEETSSQRTLHAVVNGEDTAKGNLSNDIVPNVDDNVNKKYSFGEEELHYSIYTKGSGKGTKELRKTDRAMSTLLKLTQKTDVDFFEVNEVLMKALKTYGVPIKALNAENDFALVDVNKRIFEILSIVQKQKYIHGDTVTKEIALAIKHALNNSKFGADIYKSERKEIASFLKDVGDICLSWEQKSTLKDMGLDFMWFKQNMYMLSQATVIDRPSHFDREQGKFTRGAVSLDEVWAALSNAYPQLFSPEISAVERPIEMIMALEELKPQLVGVDEYFAQGTDVIAIKLANEVLSGVIDLKYNKLKDDTVKAEVEKLNKQHADSMQKWISKQESQRGRKGIEKIYGELYKKISKPTKKQSIPEDFILPTARLLKSLGLSKGILDNRATKRIKNEKGEWITVPNDRQGQPIIHDAKVLEKGEMLGSKIPYGKEEKLAEISWLLGDETQPFAPGTINENLLKIANLLKDKEKSRFGEGYDMDIDLKLIEDMESFADSVRKQNIYDMTAEETSRLHSILFRYRNTLASANRLNSENISETLGELGWNTINELNAQGESKVLNSVFNKQLFFDTADALTMFERFGPSGMKIYRELRAGFDTYTLDIAKVKEFAEKHLNSKNVRKWMKERNSFELLSGQTVELSDTEIMNLYCLNERKHARGHLYENDDAAGKIVVKDKKGKDRTYTVTEGDINKIISELDKEQKDCCEEMMKFLSEDVAEWGNEVTMRRYLYRAFTVERYFPIIVDGMSFKINDFNASETASFWGVANPKASKQTQEGARKSLIIQDVFDVFAKHCGDMAMYHGMGEAVMDAMKWYNYSPGGDNSVREAMSYNLSNKACEWFETFIKDLNGAVKSEDVSMMQGFIRGAKSAAIWMNMRVVVQQPTAYIRAANVIDPKYLINPRNLNIVNRIADKENYEKGSKKALKYCPIVMFKNWGYFSNDIGKSTKDMMLNTENAYEKAKSIGFALAGKADMMTLGWLWNACENQVADTNKNLKKGTEEFNKAVAELLTRVVDETQVVDTPFHRSQIRRRKTNAAQVFSAFIDEPIKSYNMIVRAVLSGDGKKVARALATHVATVVLGQALVKALYDLIVKWDRDDDEDKKRGFDDFFELYLKNLIEDLNPLNLHPYLSLVSDLAMDILSGILPENNIISSNSYSTSSLESAGLDKLGRLLKNLGKLINPDKEVKLSAYGWIYSTAEVVGTFTGIGVQNVMNTATSIWNQKAPANLKITKTEYSNTYMAEGAVDALLKGETDNYEFYYKELYERYEGDEAKINSALAGVLSKSNHELFTEAYEANQSGNKAARDAAYSRLEALGFEQYVIKRAVESYEATYNNYVKKAAEAQIKGDTEAYDEALDWIKEQGVFDDKYEDDIARKKTNLEEEALEEDTESAYETQFLINALNNGEMDSYEAAFDELIDECKIEAEEKAVYTKIKTAVTKNYKLDYWLAYRDGDKAKIKEIEKVLEETELYEGELWDTTKEWIKENIRACYKSAVGTKDLDGMNRYKRMLLKSGVYSSRANALKALETWRKEEQQKK